jgi:hypothetical protein
MESVPDFPLSKIVKKANEANAKNNSWLTMIVPSFHKAKGRYRVGFRSYIPKYSRKAFGSMISEFVCEIEVWKRFCLEDF